MLRLLHTNDKAGPFFKGRRVDEYNDPFWQDYQLSLNQNNREARPSLWVHYKGEFYDPFWEDLLQSYQQNNEASREYDLCDPFWIESHSKAKTAEIKPPPPSPMAKFKELVQTQGPEIKDRFKEQVKSPEFWLGIAFGAATRISTKLAILNAFPNNPELATLAGFIACACAGIAAGVITYFVRMLYRNSKLAPGKEKEKYWGKALIESAVIGLFGGILGGYATNAGTVIARSGSLAAGASIGLAAGILHAGVKGYRASQGQQAKLEWGKLAFQSAIFSALGGVFGVTFTDLFGAHDSVAASVPVGDAGSVVYVPPAVSHVPDYCGDPCGTPPAPPPQPAVAAAPVTPVHAAPLEPQEVKPRVVEKTAKPHVQRPTHHHGKGHTHEHTHRHTHHHRGQHHEKPRAHHHEPDRKVVKAKHIRHVKKLRHLRPKLTPVEQNIVLDKEKFLRPPPSSLPPPPPRVAAPPLVVIPAPPVDPCTIGDCADPCRTISKIDIKGPCSDPNTPCEVRVSFNDDGIATKAVLTPSRTRAASAYYEIKQAARNTATNNHTARVAQQVALVVPVTNNASLALGFGAPTPV